MATESFRSSSTNFEDKPTIKKINDGLYEFYKPASGRIAINIIFFHGLHGRDTEDAYKRTWMLADDSACWLNTLLPQEFPNARILSVSYDACVEVLESSGRMDMYTVGENLVQSIIRLDGTGRDSPVVLVGHCVGGLVLKEVCVKADEMAARNDCPPMDPCNIFLKNMKGAFFYSTSGYGLRGENDLDHTGPLLRYLSLWNKEAPRLNSDFSKLRKRYGWTTSGVSEANGTEDFRKMIRRPNPTLLQTFLPFRLWHKSEHPEGVVVDEGSARADMDNFCVLRGENYFTICKPKDETSDSFQLLIRFVQELLSIEDAAVEQWKSFLQLPRAYVSMPTRVEGMIRQLKFEDDEFYQVAMVGMGGIGKSTLAKEILAQVRHLFDFVCFVANVKERLARHDLHHLVSESLYYGNGRKVPLQAGDVQSIWLLLRGKKVLMIMDDVDSEDLIRPLLRSDWCARGSRLLVTSRVPLPEFVECKVPFLSTRESAALFRAHLTPEHESISKALLEKVIEKCDGLPLTLEVTASYLSDKTEEDVWISTLEKLSKAESLNGSANDRLWSKLKVSFDDLAPAETRLFLDAAVLDNCDPQMPPYDLRIWKAAWKTGIDGSTIKSCLRNLEDRCFIVRQTDPRPGGSGVVALMNRIHECNFCKHGLSCSGTTVEIHQQLRDLAKSMSRKPEIKIELCRSVWLPKDIVHLLQAFKGEQAHTEILSVPKMTVEQSLAHTTFSREYRWSSIGQLRELRFLRMSSVRLVDNNAQRFPPKLAFLHLTSCRGGPTIKSMFSRRSKWPIREGDIKGLDSLACLLLDSCNAVNLPSNFHHLQSLKILSLRGIPSMKLPPKFGCLPGLKYLLLDNIGISELPDSFWQLSSLKAFTLRGCSKLKTWPVPKSISLVENILSPMRRLRTLRLENLPSLAELPESFGLMSSLEILVIIGCSACKHLPEGFSGLQKLRHLFIEGCDRLESICVGELRVLTTLRVTHCPSLHCLPDSIGDCRALMDLYINEVGVSSMPEYEEMRSDLDRYVDPVDRIGQLKDTMSMYIQDCPTLQSLPESIGQLNMVSMYIQNCSALQRMPDSIGQLQKLSDIHIGNCSALQSLPDSIGQLQNLSKMHIVNCSTLQSLPDSIGQLQNLKYMHIEGCSSLHSLPNSIGQLQNLNDMHVGDWSTLYSLPESIGQLQNLKNMHVGDCSTLHSLPDSIGQLQNLLYLHVGACSTLQSLPDSIGQLQNLVTMHIGDCATLHSLPDSIGQLQNLVSMHIGNCSTLQSLPDSIGQLQNLSYMHIGNCSTLQSLPDSIGQLQNLSYMHIGDCSTLQSLPDSILQLENLRNMHIGDCSTLRSLPDSIGQLHNLETMHIGNCSTLQSLPHSIGQLHNLKSMHIGNCSTLQSLPHSIGQLQNLSYMHIGNCSTLQSLPDSIGQLQNMNELHIGDISTLQRLPDSIGQLQKLTYMQIGDCSTLQSLPDSIGQLHNLIYMHIGHCSALQSLPDSIGQLQNLSYMYIGNCSTLQSLPDSIGELQNLYYMYIGNCSTLRSLPDSIGQLQMMKLERWS